MRVVINFEQCHYAYTYTFTYSYTFSYRELGCELGYRLIIGAEAEQLCVWHVPALAGGERVSSALTPHAPSMERLLAHTVHVRSRQRLNDLKVLLNDLGVS